MSTIDDRYIIKTMLQNDGRFGNDPRAKAIFLYRNLSAGKWTHSVCYDQEAIESLEASPYVGANLVLWDEEDGISGPGQDYIDGAEPESLFIAPASEEESKEAMEEQTAEDTAEMSQEEAKAELDRVQELLDSRGIEYEKG